MQWSPYSEAIFDHWHTGNSNMVVQACPGAGKTTNIAHIWGLDAKPTVYVVFAKQNQVEAEAKLTAKPGSAVLTTHSLGLRAISATWGRPEIDDKKVMKLIWQYITPKLKRMALPKDVKVADVEWALKKAVDVAKFSCDGVVCDDETYRHMVNTFDLDTYEGMQDDISTILDANDVRMERVDFNDMIRLPALYQCSLPSYTNVLADEVQDFNSMQAKLLSKLSAEKYCFVGDRHQSIYGFRGAMLDSMDYLAHVFQCEELPLSISYRCPKKVVEVAAKIWPSIEPWEQSPDGQVSTLDPDGEDMLTALGMVKNASEALILCRNNSPLITYAYRLLSSNIPCHVRGREIGQGLAKLIKKFPVSTIAELLTCLGEWYSLECSKAMVSDDEAQRQRVEDKYSSLLAFTQHVKITDHPDTLLSAVESLFAQGKGVALSTVHKAKGLEARYCYLLASDLFGKAHQRARSHWQREQEKNVQYVAVTRAQEGLVYC